MHRYAATQNSRECHNPASLLRGTHYVSREMISIKPLATVGLLLAGLTTAAHAQTYPLDVSRNIDGLQSKCAYMSNAPKVPACIE
jgi:hypothetical protein